MNHEPSPQFQIEFLKKLQRLLNEGQFTASYKFALLMAIADICVERGSRADQGLEITSQELAEKFVLHYWRHAAPFKDGELLVQSKRSQARVLTFIKQARNEFGTFGKLRKNKRGWRRLTRKVAKKIEGQPLWKLQRVRGDVDDFLYPQNETHDCIILSSDVGITFTALYPLVKDLIEGHWIKFVSQLPRNRELLGPECELQEFMFGTDRNSLQRVKPVLIELQKSTCFYCGARIRRAFEVDHFIPWSMYSYDLGHNFVLSCKTCNRDKKDRLAAIGHLEKWVGQNTEFGSYFAEIAATTDFVFDLSTSFQVAKYAYGFAQSANEKTWIECNNVLEPLQPGWKELLSVQMSSQ